MAGLFEHFQKGTFEQEYWIPAHNARRESALFKSNKQLVRDDCGAPCWICGAKNDLEVHHVFEWAFWNAMDPKKVTNILEAIEFYDEKYVSSVKDPVKLQTAILDLEASKPIMNSPAEGGLLTKEQLIIAAERVLKIDDELASIAANNYQPHR